MTSYSMTRRQVSMALAGTAAVTMLPKVSFAAELAMLKLGDIAVSTISDGHFDLPNNWFANASTETLAAAGDPIRAGANVWLVRSKDRLILIDTGSGKLYADSIPTVGKLDALLAAEGINKNDITDIVITHMHGDHIGGLMRPDAGGFSKAKIHMAEAEWTYWTNPELVNQVPDEMKDTIKLTQAIAAPIADRVTTYADKTDLGGGLNLVSLPGHTPGHSGVRISDGGEELLIVGDAIISETLQFKDPDITYVLDFDKQQAIKTRVELLSQLSETNKPFAATHLSYPGMGRVRQVGDRFKFEPLA